jgi:hypothetical protein
VTPTHHHHTRALELRLLVRDRLGRTAAATRRIYVEPITLKVTRWTVPARVHKGARRLTFTVATSVRASLHAGGRRFQIGPRPRRITVGLPAKPKLGFLKVTVRISALGVRQPSIATALLVLRV